MAESVKLGAEAEEGHPQRRLILIVMSVSLVLVVSGISSLNLAIPSIRNALAASNTELLWIVDSYGLAFAGLLLPAGALGDRYGRKEALITGLGIFLGGALSATFATTPVMLIGGRSAMGIGSALIMPATLSIIAVVFPPSERTKAIAVWVGFSGAGGALGVLAGGFLLNFFWWGSVFFITIPFALVVLIAVITIVPTSRDEEQRSLDIGGSILSIAGLGILLFGIIEGPERGWTDGLVLSFFGAAAVLILLFVLWELRVKAPMLDPRYFKNSNFTLGSLALAASFMAMFGFFLLNTLYLQYAQGHSPLGTAVRTIPFGFVLIALAPRSPALATRFGTRVAIVGGMLMLSTGLVGLTFLAVASPYWHLLVWLVVLSCGMAILMPPSTTAIVSSLPQSKAGVSSAVNDTTREVGGAIGIALLGSLLSVGYRTSMNDTVSGLPVELAESAHDSIGEALWVAGKIGGEQGLALSTAAGKAFTDGIGLAYLVGAGIIAAAAATIAIFHPRDDGS